MQNAAQMIRMNIHLRFMAHVTTVIFLCSTQELLCLHGSNTTQYIVQLAIFLFSET